MICQHVANYLANPQQSVDEIWRVLRPGGRCYVALTAVAPYTEGYQTHGDVVRFTPASPGTIFGRFTDVQVMRAGGVAQAAWNYLPARLRLPALQRLVNTLDPRIRTNITMAFFVFATK